MRNFETNDSELRLVAALRCAARERGGLAGADGMPWQDPEGAARAFNIAETVLTQL
jgi:hypothetical protein